MPKSLRLLRCTAAAIVLAMVACHARTTTVVSPLEPSGSHEPSDDPPIVIETGSEAELRAARRALLDRHDTDCDQKITREDRGPERFVLRIGGEVHGWRGVYVLSNLLQELSIAISTGEAVRLDRVDEDPIARTSRRIRAHYWDALTRTVDRDGLPAVLDDRKLADEARHTLYVPDDDARALAYFRQVAVDYQAAYDRLEAALAGAPVAALLASRPGHATARALDDLLSTSDGRTRLLELQRAWLELSAEIGYTALSQHLARALTRVRDAIDQAERTCVQADPVRRSAVADRIAKELWRFIPHALEIRPLPPRDTWPRWVASLGNAHGPLCLALREDAERGMVGVPFVVPGGRFNEMYGWDSYFIVLGLIADDRLELARDIIDDFAYSIEHYGAVLNANRTYYLTRSHPPFLTSMIRSVWEATPGDRRDEAWLARVLSTAILEYRTVWSQEQRRIASLCRGTGPERACLARYAGRGHGPPPEVEPGHFDALWAAIGRSLEHSYVAGRLAARDLEAELDAEFRHDRCMRESGHDTTYRWFQPGEHRPAENRCADMATVDLNSLLYKVEVDIAWLLQQLPKAPPLAEATPQAWCARAQHRMALMQEHLWSPDDGLFYDAFVVPGRSPVRTGYVSATTLYPLWATQSPCSAAAASTSALHEGQAAVLVARALAQLEAAGGLVATAEASRNRYSRRADRQWDYPSGWAPHQMIAWAGLRAHGFDREAERLISAWLEMLLVNVVDYNGTIPEKYDVVERTHAVFAEYGNVGTQFDYITEEGFAWMNASFQVGLGLLDASARDRLERAVAERSR